MKTNIMDKFSVCGLCNAKFTLYVPSDVEQAEIGSQENNLAGPVQSAACTHIVCFQCVKQQTLMLPPNNQDLENQLQGDVRCPICLKPNAFNVENPIISAAICNLLKVVCEQSLFIEQAWGQEEDCKMPSSQPKEVADLDDDPNSPTKTPDLNLMGKKELKAAHFTATSDTYVYDEEEDLPHHQGVAQGKKRNFKVAPGEHLTDIYSDDEEETFLSNERPFVRVPRDDGSSDDHSDGNQEGAKKQDSKVKSKADTYISLDRGPDLSHQLQYETISDVDEFSNKVEEVSPTPTVSSSNQNPVVERPPRPPSLPGAFHIVGPHLDPEQIINLQESADYSTGAELVQATRIEDAELVPELPLAYGEPWIELSTYGMCKHAFVSFCENYKWFIIWVFVLTACVTLIAILLVTKTQHWNLEQGPVRRRNSLKQIILRVSNQTSDIGLGEHQLSAMNWTFGPDNDRFDPVKDQDRIVQRYALATLFYSTNGTKWLDCSDFLTSFHECDWCPDYIKCRSDDLVYVIDLYYNNLVGNVPSDIGHLKQLTKIDLTCNALSGTIPDELGNLILVQDFRLNCNIFSGTIPSQLGNLKQLSVLWLDQNQLTGTIPRELGSLDKLTHLYLYINQLSGAFPRELCYLTQVRWMQLEGNNISGTIPSELGNLTQLLILNLGNNTLSGSIPSQLGNLTQLSALYLDNNNLSGVIPRELDSLTKLTELTLHGNNFDGTIPNEWCSTHMLQLLPDGVDSAEWNCTNEP